MPGFIYYAKTSLNVATPGLRDGLGLSHIACESDRVENRQCLGPEGSGLLFQRRVGGEPTLRYEPGKQEWVKCDGGKFWLGYTKGERPTPDDLKRTDGPGGFPVKLGDGHTWIAPVITALPAAFGLSDGQIITTHDDRFAGLRDDADRVYRRAMADAVVQNGGEPDPSVDQITREECFDIACRALAHNYRVGRWELASLKAITTDNMASILEALIDLPTIIELGNSISKKNASNNTPGGPDTSSGSGDSPRDSDQPTQTST